MEALLIIFGGMALVAILTLYSSFSWGYILFKFWGWFILPVFTTAPHISFMQAIGLTFVIALFNAHQTNDMKDEYKNGTKGSRITTALLVPWVTLLLGWFVYLFI